MIEQIILIDADAGNLLIEDVINDIEIFPIEQIHIEIIKTLTQHNETSYIDIKDSGFTTYSPQYEEITKIKGSFLIKKLDLEDKVILKTIIRITDDYLTSCIEGPLPYCNKKNGLELLHCKFTSISNDISYDNKGITFKRIQFECNELYYIKREEDLQEEFIDQLLS